MFRATRILRFQMPAGIPKTQKAIVVEKLKGPLLYKDVEVPIPKPNEILVNVKYSGVCHSDYSIWNGDFPLPELFPLIGGHEGAGVVVAKGDAVTNFSVGDLAGIKWLNKTCLTCEPCIQGHESSCAHADLSGYTHAGTFQQYATADAVQAAKIPKGTDLAGVAPVLCAGITVYKGLKTANLKPGDWVAISGAGGGLGAYAVQYAVAMGLRVIGIDGGEEKGDLVRSLGAEEFVDFKTTDDIVAEIVAKTDGGAHGVLNVAVSEDAITQSTQYVRPSGKIVLISLPAGAVAKSPVFNHVLKSLSLLGSYVGNRADSAEAIDFFVRGKVQTPIKVVGLSQLQEVYDLMGAKKIAGRYVVDTSR